MANRKQVLKQMLTCERSKCFRFASYTPEAEAVAVAEANPPVVPDGCKLLSPVEIKILALTVTVNSGMGVKAGIGNGTR